MSVREAQAPAEEAAEEAVVAALEMAAEMAAEMAVGIAERSGVIVAVLVTVAGMLVEMPPVATQVARLNQKSSLSRSSETMSPNRRFRTNSRRLAISSACKS